MTNISKTKFKKIVQKMFWIPDDILFKYQYFTTQA